jgi:hypothetical protein
VQALAGYDSRDVLGPEYGFLSGMVFYSFTGNVGGWSDTQAINVTHLSLSVLSPQAVRYNGTDIPLNFTLSKPVSQIMYSLDGHENVTIAGNTTLAGLFNGAHNVTVYAADEFGYIGASENAVFNVEVPVPTQEPEPFPTTLVMASIVVVAVAVCAGLIVYFKKHKR